ncbi:MAG: cobyric acid synthase [Spirochaetales bacterium]|nr:cobyric acid synthase [Spirochaetales bacterium]
MAKSIMIQGTASNAGKSILVTALCRIYRNRGFSVAPFKAQNMALNSYVTAGGLEMGRAQVTQSLACGKEPDIRMNPVLLKPSSGMGSQLIVLGKPDGSIDMINYKTRKKELRKVIAESYTSLSSENDLIILEGAGSPAEVNLKKDDIVNMGAARMAGAPVLLVGDIDRGGVFASLLGTMNIFTPAERKITKGYIINKFHGDVSLLEPACAFLKKKTHKPVLGVIPYFRDLALPDEDSVEFKKSVGKNKYNSHKPINIALIDLAHISNFTDFDPFYQDDDVNFYSIDQPEQGESADIIILPGSKNVIYDLEVLRSGGMDKLVKKKAGNGAMIIGICGGYQMLGKEIADPLGLESTTPAVKGLGLLEMTTILEKEKHLTQTTAWCDKEHLQGYEIHHGQSTTAGPGYIINDKGETLGMRNKAIWGTYLHGIFDNHGFRRKILNEVRHAKGLPPLSPIVHVSPDHEIDRLASLVQERLDMTAIDRIIGIRA